MHPFDNPEALLRQLTPARSNHYFYGKRMDVQHFQMEQDYGKRKQWLLNRLTLGKGVICGLRVTVENGRLCVDPGVAIDGLGREIVVPVRQCIDPLTNDGGCCVPCCDETPPAPPPTTAPPPTVPPPSAPSVSPGNPEVGGTAIGAGGRGDDAGDDRRPRLYTLWLCYKECKTDFEPVLVSECQTRQPCAAGTIVESFCLKVAPGAPLQLDPDWCAHLWPRRRPPGATPPATAPRPPGTQPAAPALVTAPPPMAADVGGALDDFVVTPRDTDPDAPTPEHLRDSFESRRRILCRLFGESCDPGDDDPCVPLGAFVLRDRRIVRFDACLVRPRIYSNAQLLDLILCLADRIDECCNGHEPPPPAPAPMRLEAVDFLGRVVGGAEAQIATMANPLVDTPIDINRNMNAIRMRFSQAYAQDRRKPTTPDIADPDFKRHNVQILPDDVLNSVPFVAGTLTLESLDTLRFDISPESPYRRSQGGWQKGRYRVFLRGTEDLASGHQALGNTAGAAFDGEPIAPAGGHISGNTAAGGDFVGAFIVGGGAPPSTLRVRSVDFLLRDGDSAETVVAAITSPLDRTTVPARMSSIRVRFTKPLAADGPTRPTTHGMDDANHERHNVQVLLAPRDAAARGVEYVPGTVAVEAPDTLRFDVLRGSRIVGSDGQWPSGTTNFRLVLRGTAQAGKPALASLDGTSLDGNPTAPAGGVISGDGTAGGDFTAAFAVVVRR